MELNNFSDYSQESNYSDYKYQSSTDADSAILTPSSFDDSEGVSESGNVDFSDASQKIDINVNINQSSVGSTSEILTSSAFEAENQSSINDFRYQDWQELADPKEYYYRLKYQAIKVSVAVITSST